MMFMLNYKKYYWPLFFGLSFIGCAIFFFIVLAVVLGIIKSVSVTNSNSVAASTEKPDYIHFGDASTTRFIKFCLKHGMNTYTDADNLVYCEDETGKRTRVAIMYCNENYKQFYYSNVVEDKGTIYCIDTQGNAVKPLTKDE